MNNLRHAYQQVHNEWRSLQRQWQGTCEVWNDAIRDNFEREHWLNFEHITHATLKEIENLSDVIAKAYREIPRC
jgi:hypothetical protein